MKKLLIGFSLLVFQYSFLKAQTWDSLGGRMRYGHNYTTVSALCVYNGNLFVGGEFDTIGNKIPAAGIAQWNGASWDTLKSGGGEYATAFLVFNGNLVDMGFYPMFIPEYNDYIGVWNGSDWDTIGAGLQNNTQFPHWFSLCEYAGDLYACGTFAYLNHYALRAKWNGSSWDSIPDNFHIWADAMVEYNNKLYLGGSFNFNGMNNIGAWNDTVYSLVGTGVNGYIAALLVWNGKLYAGGEFDSAGGKPAKNIAVWDGNTWSALGSGVSNVVNALAVYGNVIVAGGSFDTAGGQLCNKIAYWNGINWSPLGTGITGTDAEIVALTTYNGSVFVGGKFDSAGGISANNIAQWTSPLGINELRDKSEEVRVYPNPNNGIFTIALGHAELVSASQTIIEIYNILGQKVNIGMLKQVQHDYLLNLSNQPDGIYLYRVINEDGSLVGEGKIVIQK